VDLFNNSRLFEPIGNIPAVELEQLYNEGQNARPSGPDSTKLASGKPGRFKQFIEEKRERVRFGSRLKARI
jgi:hypothetical protein